MKRLSLIFAIAAAGILVSGCKSGSKIVGKWKGATATQDAKNPMNGLGNQLAASSTLELKDDHTFSMVLFLPMSGTWSESGDILSLKPDSVAGIKPVEGTDNAKPMTLRISADGTTLSPQDGERANQNFVFKRDN